VSIWTDVLEWGWKNPGVETRGIHKEGLNHAFMIRTKGAVVRPWHVEKRQQRDAPEREVGGRGGRVVFGVGLEGGMDQRGKKKGTADLTR